MPVQGHDMVVGDDETPADDKAGARAFAAVDLDHDDRRRITRGNAGDERAGRLLGAGGTAPRL